MSEKTKVIGAAPHRARVMGHTHSVSAGHYLAAQAAFQILDAGGNAIDAGVAGGIALGVVQSEYVGFGGVAPIMIRLAETGRTWTFAGVGHWPAATDVEVFRRRFDGRIPRGILRTVVPAAPASWIAALERFGTMSYGEVASAALRFARDGFPMPSLMRAIIGKHVEDYRSYESNAAIYLPGGNVPEVGDRFVQSDLASVIAYMIDEEKRALATGDRIAGLRAARDAFYRGDIAAKMVEYHTENGGWLAMADLEDYEVQIEEATPSRFGEMDVFTCGSWCQGPVLAQTVGMLNGRDLRSLGHNSVEYIHLLTEALKLAYADRHAYVGDPNFVDVPYRQMVAPDYLAERGRNISMMQAVPGMPEPGDPRGFAAPTSRPAVPEDEIEHLDTSYICVVDKEGNAFSATPSDGSATAPVIPGLGFVPSARGVQSWTDADAPAVVGPGRRPRLTPNPVIVHKPDHFVQPIGSPGNDVQPQAILQVMLNMHVFGMSPQDAVEAPRFATFSYPRSSEPHSYDPGLLKLEGRIETSIANGLAALGHDVQHWPDWEWTAGAVCTILADRKRDVLEGGSDPRRPTAALAW
ncbi:gamma-glutamyltransferase [Pelagibacterium sp. H642]|uniref:gamma-glutamyltransferase family protein n=1 Tax=Pelagibacterium sp. H642 TaxID=1881069 RepID=UPI002815021D|nr:gamma-glutamyltransferase [Pelagibacterium sp. H642]WMT89377.1 gamma-glutamyltransferase [Pelagibacterium sp. H642]